MTYSRLFTPITIGNMTLKNRIVMPAMHHLYTENGYCTPGFQNTTGTGWRAAPGSSS